MKWPGINNIAVELRVASLHALCSERFRVLYLSDFHFRKGSGDIAGRILKAVLGAAPDVIMLGGDYAESREGLAHLCGLVKSLAQAAPVLAIAGNHDYFFGISRIEAALTASGASWIERGSAAVRIRGTQIRIDGNPLRGFVPDDGADVTVLCLHNPAHVTRCSAAYSLAFAGHLHGGQVVLWQGAHGLYPARLFYRWARPKAMHNGYPLFISKGLGDTLPLRYNCKREIIAVDILPL